MNNYRNSEKKRLLYTLIVALVLGVVTGYYWQFLVLGLLLYGLWMLGKLLEFDHWLSNGRESEKSPYASGLWGRAINHILRLNKELDKRKKNYQQLMVRLNKILRTFPHPIIIINSQQEITWISKTASKMLNLKRKKDIGLRIGHIIRASEFQTMLDAPENNDGNEFIWQSPNNPAASFSIALSPLNKDTRLLSIRDISKRRQLEKLKNTFIANASHELRTPLTVVNGYLELLNNSKNLDKPEQEMVQKAHQKSLKMAELISDLLTFTHLENNPKPQRLLPVKFSDCLNNTIALLPDCSNSLTQDIDDELTVLGIRSDLESMVNNLIENALKYRRNNTKINLVWQLIDNQPTLKISNQLQLQHSLDNTTLTRLTEPFYRANADAQIQGTGLGLSIVNQIVKKHQAQLELVVEANQLNVFVVFTGSNTLKQ